MEYSIQLFLVISISILFFVKNNVVKYFILISAFSAFFPWILNSYIPKESQINATMLLSNISAHTLLFSLAIMLPALIKHRIPYKEIFAHIALANAIYMFGRFLFSSNHEPYALGLARSFDGVLLAILFPCILEYIESKSYFTKSIYILINILYTSLIIAAILLVKGTNGIALLIISIAIYYKLKLRVIIPLILASILTLKLIPHFIHDSGRFEHYKLIWTWWTTLPIHTMLFGTGIGTYAVLGPKVQYAYSLSTGYQVGPIFTILHNDWFQFLIEFGIIGFTIISALSASLIYKSRHNSYLLSSIICFFGAMVFYYPVHIPVTALFGSFLIDDILKHGDN